MLAFWGTFCLIDFIHFRPEDTIWEGGCFFLRIEISENYPETVPSIRFVTHMFHPNSSFEYFV